MAWCGPRDDDGWQQEAGMRPRWNVVQSSALEGHGVTAEKNMPDPAPSRPVPDLEHEQRPLGARTEGYLYQPIRGRAARDSVLRPGFSRAAQQALEFFDRHGCVAVRMPRNQQHSWLHVVLSTPGLGKSTTLAPISHLTPSSQCHQAPRRTFKARGFRPLVQGTRQRVAETTVPAADFLPLFFLVGLPRQQPWPNPPQFLARQTRYIHTPT